MESDYLAVGGKARIMIRAVSLGSQGSSRDGGPILSDRVSLGAASAPTATVLKRGPFRAAVKLLSRLNFTELVSARRVNDRPATLPMQALSARL